MKDAENNVEFAVFGDTNDRVGAPRGRKAPTHMRAEVRMSLYLTVAGLIDGGFSLKDAAALVANEYQASGKRMESASVGIFFSGLGKADGAGVGDLADRAFGRNFVGIEEMALLRALPNAKNMAPILRTAAALISAQSGGVPDTAVAASRG